MTTKIKRYCNTACGLILLLYISLQESASGFTFGERALDLPAGSVGHIYNSLQGAKKVRLTYTGNYSVRAVDKQTDEWKSKEVGAVLVVDVVKSGDTYSISDSRLFLNGKQASAASVRRHVAMLAFDKARSRSSESVTLAKGTINDPSKVAQAVNYASLEQRCSIEIYGNDYLALKLKAGLSVNYGGRDYPCRECYYYKEYQTGSYFWESAYFHDAIPGRIGRFFRKSQNTETQSKSEAESEDFDFKLSKIESIP